MRTFFLLTMICSSIACSKQGSDPRSRWLSPGEHAIAISDFPLAANSPKSNAVLSNLVGHPGLDGKGSVILDLGTRVEIVSDDNKSIMKRHTYYNEQNVLSEVGDAHDMRVVRAVILGGENKGMLCEIWRYYLTPVDKQ